MLKVQEINPQIGYYLAGFADGEGSLMIVLRKRDDYKESEKISLCFNVAQKESYILSQFKKHLRCGTLRSRPDGVYYYEVNNFTAIWENVIPFFKKFRFLSQKKKNQFHIFIKAAEIIHEKQHVTQEGLRQLKDLQTKMRKIREEL